MKRALGVTLLAAFVLSCGSSGEVVAPAVATGPAHVRVEVVERHARRLEDGIGRRPAGSRAELVAGSYILAHLQKAGYHVRLDFVPVGNLVRSSNVVARAPSGEKPKVVVTVAYDGDAGGRSVGVFLEVARALRALVPRHSVEFVAVGAEQTDAKGGRLGSRRLARILLDEARVVLVVVVGDVSTSGGFSARGDAAGLQRAASALGLMRGEPASGRDVGGDAVYDRARIGNAIVAGGAEEVGRVLLRYLSSAAH